MRRPSGPARRRDRWIAARRGVVYILWRWWRWRGISLPFFKTVTTGPWLGVISFTHEERCQVKRPESYNDKPGGSTVDLPLSKILGKLDRLNDVLSSSTWDEGDLKGQRCLMLFLEGLTCRAMLKVEIPALKLSAVGRSLDESLAALDALLGAADVPWESDIPRGGPSQKKRK